MDNIKPNMSLYYKGVPGKPEHDMIIVPQPTRRGKKLLQAIVDSGGALPCKMAAEVTGISESGLRGVVGNLLLRQIIKKSGDTYVFKDRYGYRHIG